MARGAESFSESERAQRAHYDNMSEAYNLAYSDPWSVRYRDEFLHRPMFEGIDLRGKRVLDAMCGYGDLTNYLLQQGAEVTGLDISEAQIEAYQQRWGCAGLAESILDSGLPSESFDIVAIQGGLHHMPPHLNATVEEVLRLLKPGGVFCFSEPHSHSLLEWPRRLWYRLDPLFEENESSVDVTRLETAFASRFDLRETVYGGGLAYLLVFNSMVFRIPNWLKPYYSPGLFWLESWTRRLPWRSLSLSVFGRWRKPRS